MERILVTGASGLIGRHVVSSLAGRNFEVHAAVRLTTKIADIAVHASNILDRDATARLVAAIRPSIIVHCAWVTTHGAFWQSPDNLEWLGASLAMLRSAREAGMRRFIGLGTGFEYDMAGTDPKHEQRSNIEPSTLYGCAKDAMNRVASRFAAIEGIEHAWARVFMLYGAGEHPDRLVASLARALVSGKAARMSSGNVVRDFLDARDVGAAVAMLAASSLTGDINIASGEGMTLLALAEKLSRLAGKPDLLLPGAIPDRPGEPESLIADITRLRDELRFRPSITLDRGLVDALDFWQAHRTA